MDENTREGAIKAAVAWWTKALMLEPKEKHHNGGERASAEARSTSHKPTSEALAAFGEALSTILREHIVKYPDIRSSMTVDYWPDRLLVLAMKATPNNVSLAQPYVFPIKTRLHIETSGEVFVAHGYAAEKRKIFPLDVSPVEEMMARQVGGSWAFSMIEAQAPWQCQRLIDHLRGNPMTWWDGEDFDKLLDPIDRKAWAVEATRQHLTDLCIAAAAEVLLAHKVEVPQRHLMILTMKGTLEPPAGLAKRDKVAWFAQAAKDRKAPLIERIKALTSLDPTLQIGGEETSLLQLVIKTTDAVLAKLREDPDVESITPSETIRAATPGTVPT